MNTYLIYYSYKDEKLSVIRKRKLFADSMEDALEQMNRLQYIIHSCILINDDWGLVSDIALEIHKYVRDNEN